MPPQWGLGVQQGPDAGQRYQASFDQAQQRQQADALRGFQREQFDDQRQQREEQRQTQVTERQREEIRLGARIVRQINPQDDVGWQRARAAAAQAGIDVSQVPQTFDPAYRDQLLAAGQALEPQQQERQGPNIQREVEYYRSIGRPEMADQLLQRHAQGPPSVVSNGDGTFTILPQSVIQGQTGAPPPAQGQPPPPQAGRPDAASLRAQAEEAIRNGANPAQVNARLNQMLQGGAGQQGPQTFP